MAWTPNTLNSEMTNGKLEYAMWSGHICLRVAILIQGNSVPYFATRSGLGCRWPPVGLPCVSGWVAFGNPLVQGHGSVTWTKGEDGGAMIAFVFCFAALSLPFHWQHSRFEVTAGPPWRFLDDLEAKAKSQFAEATSD